MKGAPKWLAEEGIGFFFFFLSVFKEKLVNNYVQSEVLAAHF